MTLSTTKGREIKFRAWDKENKQMVYQDFPDGSFGGGMDAGKILHRYETIMQFTGLKDKNGVEIFEGDLLKMGNEKEVWQVVYDEDRFELHEVKFPKHITSLSAGGKVYEAVIGNIYENPELLK